MEKQHLDVSISLPAVWKKLIQIEFPDDLADIYSEKEGHTGNFDEKPHYDDTRSVAAIAKNGCKVEVTLASGQANYYGVINIYPPDSGSLFYESEPLDAFGNKIEVTLDEVHYTINIDWVQEDYLPALN